MENLFMKKFELEYIQDIFIRIGYETAKIKRIFQDDDFNWGAYNGQVLQRSFVMLISIILLFYQESILVYMILLTLIWILKEKIL